MADFNFSNAYRVITSVTPAGKEQNSQCINLGSPLGSATIDDNNNLSQYFSGNDVCAIGINIGGVTYYGWISRPIKVGGQVKGFYFWTDTDFTSLAIATADGNSDGDGDVSDNIGFVLVVDQSYFTSLGSGQVTVGSSSDRVDSALNSLIDSNHAPVGVADTGNAVEAGGLSNGTAGSNATGNVKSNDTDSDSGDTTTVTATGTTSANSSVTAGTTSANGTQVTGSYGTLTIGADGSYSYAVNNSNSSVEALRTSSNTLTDTFTYKISDSHGATATTTLTITIRGANDTPTANNDYNTAKEATTTAVSGFTSAGATATGNVLNNDTDKDSGDAKSIAGLGGSINTSGTVTVNGTYKMYIPGGAASTFNPVGVGDEAWVVIGGTPYALYADAAGTTKINVTAAWDSTNFVFALNAQPLYYYDSGTSTIKSVTNLSGGTLNGAAVGFKNDSTGTATTTTTSGMKQGTLDSSNGVQTVVTGSTVSVSAASMDGSPAVGMGVTGTGVPAGTTITAITYDGSGNVSTITFDKALTSTSGTALSFLGSAGGTYTGHYGSLVLNADGSYTYTPFTDIASLSSGQSGTDSFKYTMKDTAGATSTATLTVTVYGSGSSDPVAAADTNSITENSSSVTGNVLTNDTGTNKIVSGAHAAGTSSETAISTNTGVTGLYGTLTLSSTGAYTYTLDNANSAVNALAAGQTLTETFVYRDTNAPTSTGSSSTTLTITINGANDAPVASNDTATAIEKSGLSNATAGYDPSGNVLANDTDVDSAALTVASIRTGAVEGSGTAGALGSALTGAYGSLTLNANGTWSYAVDQNNATVNGLASGQSLSDSFNYTVSDGSGGTDTAVITVTIQGAADTLSVNDVFVNEASPYAVFKVTGAQNTPVTLALSNSTGLAAADTKATLGSDLSNTLEYYNGSAWVSYSGSATIPAGGTLLVRVAVNNDSTYEGNEAFSLTATTVPPGGGTDVTSATGIGTIGDEGSGDTFSGTNTTGTADGSGTDDDRPTVSISSPNVSEGDGYAEFTVSLNHASTKPVNFTPTLTGGTATLGTDAGTTLEYQAQGSSTWTTVTGPVAIAAGDTSIKLRVVITDDSTSESSEQFTLATGYVDSPVQNATGVTGTATITDNDSVNVTVSSPDVSEGSDAVFTVTLSNASASATSIALTLADVSTTASDHGSTLTAYYFDGSNVKQTLTVTGGSISLPAGVTTFYVVTTTAQDGVFEGSEGFTLTAAISGGDSDTGTASIVDNGSGNIYDDHGGVTGGTPDDDRPTVAITSPSVSESDGYAEFTVSLNHASTQAISFTPSLTSGTATVGTDTGATLQYQTQGSSTWTTVSGAVSIAAGDTSIKLRVAITDDSTVESSEQFTLNTGAITGTVKNSTGVTGTATISDNDSVNVTVSSPDVSEGSDAVFTVTLSNASASATSIALTLADVSTTASDHGSSLAAYYFDGSNVKQTLTVTGGSISLPAGVTTFYVGVSTTQDSTYEGSEGFTLTAAISGGDSDTGTASIVDDGSGNIYDDHGGVTGGTPDDDRPTVAITSPSVSEGDGYAEFTVSLNHASTQAISFTPALTSGTATIGTDTGATLQYQTQGSSTWTTVSGAVSIAAGDTSIKLRVAITDDSTSESSEQFTLGTGAITGTVTNSAGVTGTATITDNDSMTIAVAGTPDVSEGSSAIFTVTLSSASASATSIALTLGDTTTNSSDHGSTLTAYYFDGSNVKQTLTVTGGSISLPAGVTTFYVGVTTTQDSTYEGSEGFTLMAAISGGDSDTGSASIVDDGTGKFYDDKGAITVGTPDDDRPTVAITSPSVSESDGHAEFTVSLDHVSTQAISFTPSLTGGTATVGTDTGATLQYQAQGSSTWSTVSGAVSIAAGDTSIKLRVAITDDSTSESSEQFTLGTGAITGTVTNSSGVTGTATISDNDSVNVTVSSPDVSEGSDAVFTVTLSNASASATSIALTLADVTTTAGDHGSTLAAYYFDGSNVKQTLTVTGGSISLPAGVTTFYVGVSTTQDSTYEGSEGFTLTAAISGGDSDTGTASIVDDGSGNIYDDHGGVTGGTPDDDRPTVAITSPSVSESDGYAEFTVSLNHASTQAISFTPSLTSGTATTGTDTGATLQYQTQGSSTWTTVSGAASIAAGDTSIKLRVAITDDSTSESSEQFTLGTGAITGTVTNSAGVTGTATISDNDSVNVTVSSPDVSEGSDAVFTVSLSGGSASATSIALALADVTTTAGDHGSTLTAYYFDGSNVKQTLTVTGGSISLPAGVTTFYVVATTTQDAVFEGSEGFTLTAAISGGDSDTGTASIVDDGSGNTYDDHGGVAGGTPDDDRPTVAITSPSVSEGDGYAEFTVSLNHASTQAISFTPALTSGTAAVGTDTGATLQYQTQGSSTWTTVSGAVSIAAGDTSIKLRVAITDDSTSESSEQFTLGTGAITGTVTNSAGVTGTATISDNDSVNVTVSSPDVSEGSDAVFTVTLSNASASTTSIALTLADVSTTASDHGSSLAAYYFDGGNVKQTLTVTGGSISLPAGVTTFYVVATTTQDAVFEGSEGFTLTAAIGGGDFDTSSASIVDDGSGNTYDDHGGVTGGTPDDDRPTVAITSPSVSEGDGYAEFTVSLDHVSTQAISFTPSLTGGTATVGTDTGATLQYQAQGSSTWTTVSGAVSIAAGDSSIKLRVAITDDAISESSEQFTLGTGAITGTVTNSSGVTGTATISDNDSVNVTVSSPDVSEGSDAVFTVTLSNASASATSIALTLADVTTTAGDHGSTLAAYYFDGSNVKQTLTVTGGSISLPAGVTTFYVGVSTTQDSTYEGSEGFTLTAAISGGDSDTGTASIVDDGSGNTYDDHGGVTGGTPDDDRPLLTVVGSPDVSEGSNAVFTVTLTNASASATSIDLTLGDTTTDSSDYNSTLTAYYFDGSNVKQTLTVTGGSISLPAGVTTFYVAVATTDDSVLEGSESFTLQAAIPGGSSAFGSSSIIDDGTGTFYDDKGAVTTGTPDDDHAGITVTGSSDVSEGSSAVFTVTLSGASTSATSIALTLGDTTTDSSDHSGTLTAYYFDGSNVMHMLTVTSGSISLPAGVTTFYVDVATTQDSVLEDSEAFTLSAAISGGGSASGSASIVDDGTGKFYDDHGAVTGGTPDDDRPAISVADVFNVSEGSNAVFTVTLSNASASATSIALTLGDTTTDAGDYSNTLTAYYFDAGNVKQTLTVTGGSISLPAGVTTFYVAAATTQDSVFEGSESFTLTAAISAGASNTGTASIVDDGTGKFHDDKGAITAGTADDDRPTVSISSPSVSESDGYAEFTVSLDHASTQAISITPGLTSGTATIGTDTGTVLEYQTQGSSTWTTVSGPVNIAAGDTSIKLRVAITDDATSESSEQFTLETVAITGTIKNVTTVTGTATISDNDSVNVTVSSPDVSEGSDAVFTVTLSNASASATSIALTLADVSTTASDHGSTLAAYYFDGSNVKQTLTVTGGSISLPAGVTTFYVGVSTTQDSTYEGSEGFTLTAAISGGDSDTGTASIVDDGSGNIYDDHGGITGGTPDDDRPTVAITSPSVSESDGYAEFTVSLDHASTQAISFTPALTSGTATTGTDTGATLQYQTQGSSTWTTVSGAVSIAAGDTSIKLRVAITDDATSESSEQFTLDTGAITGTVTNSAGVTGTATITDNDVLGIAVTGSSGVSEGGSAIFTVNLTNPSASDTEISLALGDAADTADASDYSSSIIAYYYAGATQMPLSITGGKVLLPAGVTSFYVAVGTSADTTYEGSESLTLKATITAGASGSGASSIVDDGSGQLFDDKGVGVGGGGDDDRPTVSITSTSVSESDGYAEFTVSIDHVSTQAISFTPALASGTATAGTDTGATLQYQTQGSSTWTTVSGSVSIAAGDTSIKLRVAITDDSTSESSEQFTLGTGAITGTVTNAAGVTGTATITDNDVLGIGVTGSPNVSEGGTAIFTVSLTNPSATDTEISLVLGDAGDTASAGDYSSTLSVYYYNGVTKTPLTVSGGKIMLPAGATTFYVGVATTQDSVYEGSEGFTLSATITSGASASGSSTIVDDGSGTLYDDKGNDVGGGGNDDTPVLSVVGTAGVSEGSHAVFAVSLTNPFAADTQVAITLGAGGDTASGSDYSGSYTAYYYDGLGAKQALAVSGGAVTLPAGVTDFYVSVDTTDDTTYEGTESFTLAASTTITGPASATASIKDDGTGTFYDDKGTITTGTPDDDHAQISVVGTPDTSEGGNAVFTVSMTNASATNTEIALTLGSGADTASGSDHSSTMTAYYFDAFSVPQPLTITGGKISLPAGVTQFFVSVATTQDGVFEGTETFTLSAAITGGDSDSGTAGIVDNGTGHVYDAKGQLTTGTIDDDHPTVSVSALPDVSEGSNAIYTVTLSNASAGVTSVAATLHDPADTSSSTDYSATFTAYYVSGGVEHAISIVGGNIQVPAGVTTFYVKVPTVNDTTLEGGETLTLDLSVTGSSDSATATIVDDGTGHVYDDVGAPTAGVPDDDHASGGGGGTVPTPPPFNADLDPTSDDGASNTDKVTSIIQPDFTITAPGLLADGQTVRLLTPDGQVAGSSPVDSVDAALGKIDVQVWQLDDGQYTFTAQILDAAGNIVAQGPVRVTIVTDLDGVMPSIELAANGGDFNHDGVADWQQNNVAQLPLTSLADFQAGKAAPASAFGAILAGDVHAAAPGAAVALDPTAQLLNISLAAPEGPLPAGLTAASAEFNFSVTAQQGDTLHDMDASRAGLQTRVVIDLPTGVDATGYVKWDAATSKWVSFMDDGNLDTYDNGATLLDLNHDGKIDRVVITLTDGEFGDADGVANGMIVDPGMLVLAAPVAPAATPVYDVKLANGDHYYSTDIVEIAHMAQGTGNVFQGVVFDSLAADQGGRHLLDNYNPYTCDWYFAVSGAPMPYACYQAMPGAGFSAAAAGQGPGADYHLYLNTQGLTQLVTAAQAQALNLAGQGYTDRGTIFNTTATSAYQFNVDGYLVANQGNQAVRDLVHNLALQFRSTTDAGFVEAVEQQFLEQVKITGLPHGGAATAADVNAAFGTAFAS